MNRIMTFTLFLLASLGVYCQNKEVEKAFEQYRYDDALTLLKKEAQTCDNLLLMAQCYEKLYNYAAALNIYKELLNNKPDDLTLTIAAAESSHQAGNSLESLNFWIKADSISPENQFIKIQKTLSYYRNNNWEETIQQGSNVLKNDSVSLVLRLVGDAYLYTNKADSAIWYYLTAVRKNPEDYLVVSKLGNIYIASTFFDAAINITDNYLDSINPHQPLIGQINGMALYSAGHYTKAVDRLKRNILLGDSSYTTSYYLGMSLYAKKLYFDATTWLEKAYNQNNTDVNLLYYYGTALTKTYNRKKGIDVLEEGVEKIEKQNGMLYDFDRSFADAYLRSGNYLKAVDYYQSAFKRNSDHSPLLYNIAYCYDSIDDYKNALTFYERFMKTAPKGLVLDGEGFMEQMEKEGKVNSETVYYNTALKRIDKMKEELFFQGKHTSKKE